MSPRVLIIGIDGATWEQILPLVERGELPSFARIMAEGAWGELESTYRNNSMSAWMALLTGQNPGRFGLYGFEQPQRGSYDSRVVNSRGKLGATLLRQLGDAGYRVAAINVPPIYPPEPVNGVIVTGILTPSKESGYTYPPELAAELESIVPGYIIEPETYQHGNELRYLAQVEQSTRSTLGAWRHLWRRERWDFCIAVFVAPDRVQHVFWHHIDPEHPLHEGSATPQLARAIEDTYRRMDAVLGEVLSELDDETTLIVASDHGFGPCRRAFNLSLWLEQHGFLRHAKRVPDPTYFDFIDHLLEAEIETPIFEFAAAKETMFSIGRNWRRVLFEHPPCILRWQVVIPSQTRFRASLALDPVTWGDTRGGGVEFAVRVDGETLFRQVINPKRMPADRCWHECEIDLGAFAGRSVRFELVTGYDESGSGIFAWAGWANPRLVSADPQATVERLVDEEEWIDWAHTLAYAYDDASVRLNVLGREVQGIIAPGEAYERVREQVRQALMAVRNPEAGGPLFSRVRRREEVCWGDCSDDEADLLLEFADPAWTIGVPSNSGRWTVGKGESAAALWGPTGATYPSGTHRPQGVLLAFGRGVRPGRRIHGARIIDIAPTVLSLLGHAPPPDMDGAPLVECLDQAIAGGAPLDGRPDPADEQTGSYSAEDEAKVRRRLAALGYVEE